MAFKSYDIDFKKLVRDLIDGLRRDDFTVEWIHSLIAAIKSGYENFQAFSAEQDDLVKYAPGYTIQLEALLNEKFGSSGITITNNKEGVPADYAYERGDSRNKYDYERMQTHLNSYSFDRGTHDQSFRNFTVNVPSALVFNQAQMEAYIKLYAGWLSFEIVTY